MLVVVWNECGVEEASIALIIAQQKKTYKISASYFFHIISVVLGGLIIKLIS